MAKPNYSFEKRQRELAKKKKKEEKEKGKAVRKTSGEGSDETSPAADRTDTEAAATSVPATGPTAS